MSKGITFFFLMFLFISEVLFAQTLKKDAVVTFRVISGKTGAVVDGFDTVFSVSSTDSTLIKNNVQDTKVKSTRSGSIDLQLIRNIEYRASVSFFKNGVPVSNAIEASDGKSYVLPREAVLFTPPSDLRTFVDFVLVPSDVFLDVNVVDEKGAAVSSGYVQAYSEVSNSATIESKEHVVGDRVTNGKVTLPVLPDRPYRVSFSAPSSALVSPEPMQVIVGRSGRYGLKFPLRTAEHSIVTTGAIAGEIPKPDAVSFFFCYAYNRAGQSVNGISGEGGTATLMVENTKGAEWLVSCQMILYRDSSEVFYKGEVGYEVNGKLSNSIVVPLEQVDGYLPETAYAISGGAESTVKTPDGETVLSIPEGVFSDGDDVSVVLQTGRGYVTTSSSAPLVAYDIKFYKNGSQVKEVGAPVVISIPVDKDKVEEQGGTVEDVYPASYDEVNGKWVRETNYSYDGSSNTIKIYASHFSVWGLLVDLLKSLVDTAPVNLRVAVPQMAATGKSVVRLYWDKPVDGSGTEYLVEIATRSREVLAANQGGNRRKAYRYSVDWAKAIVRSTTVLKMRTKLAKGTYQFRVKAVGGAFSKPTQFRVR